MSPNSESAAEIADITNTERVYQAVTELVSMGQGVTPKAVQDLTGMQRGPVDDRLRALADCGRIRRLARGFYGPVDKFAPPRIVSTSILEDGCVKLELGEECWLLTPEEHRRMAVATAGAAIHHAAIQASANTQEQTQELRAEIARLAGSLRNAQAEIDAMRQDSNQTPLPL